MLYLTKTFMYKKQPAELLQLYRKYMDEIFALPDEDFTSLAKFLKYKQIKKGDILLEAGMVCKYFWFLGEGCPRLFINKNDIVIMLISFSKTL